MKALQGQKIYLRALEPEDLDFIYLVENDEEIWHVSQTQTPYSYYLIKQYLENAHLDIYEAKQLRMVICCIETKKTVGLIDLFDFDPKNRRAGVGILLQSTENRNKGYGSEAVQLMIKYSFEHLNLNQLYANISVKNEASMALFIKFGFQLIGIKKAWNLTSQGYEDEGFYQLINN